METDRASAAIENSSPTSAGPKRMRSGSPPPPRCSSRTSTRLIDDFYAEIERHPDARKVITGGQAQIERLKGTLVQWLRELSPGRTTPTMSPAAGGSAGGTSRSAWSRSTPTSRCRGCGPGWSARSTRAGRATPPALKETVRSLNKLLDLDLAIIEDAYQAEYAARLQRSERLATLGQVAGGVAHELRNPLNVVKTSVYYLLNARNPTPEKKAEHLRRIERHVDAGRQRHHGPVELRPDADARPAADRRRAAGARGARDQPAGRRDRGARVDCPRGCRRALGDVDQLRIVLGNLIRNARDAMPQGGRLTDPRRDVVDGHVEIVGHRHRRPASRRRTWPGSWSRCTRPRRGGWGWGWPSRGRSWRRIRVALQRGQRAGPWQHVHGPPGCAAPGEGASA